MRVHQLILMFAWTCLAKSKSITPFRRLIFDATKHLEGILTNQTLITDLIQTLESQHATKNQKLSILYSVECDKPSDCNEKFIETENLAISINNNSNLDFILSWTVTRQTTDNFIALRPDWKEAVNISWLQNSKAKFLINHHKSVNCADLLWTLRGISRITEPVVPGIGYDESLVECGSFSSFKKFAFHVVYFSFGETIGVTESFGLFRRRINFLNFRQQNFLKKLATHSDIEVAETLYYPYKESVGDVCHQRLLENFGKKWLDGHDQQLGLIIQAPDPKTNERIETNNFKLVANMHKDGIAPGIINAASLYFDSVVLNQENWKNLPTFATARQNRLNLNSNNNSLVPLEIFLYPGWKNDEISKAAAELIEWKTTKPFQNIHVWLMITFEKSAGGANNFDIAKLLASDFPFGCVVISEFSEIRNFAVRVKTECTHYESRMYYFEKYLRLDLNAIDSEIYSFFYENTIRKELQELYERGNLFLKGNAGSRRVISFHFSNDFDSSSNVTNFCNDDALHLNEYYEAIVNWAKCNNVDIVLKSPISQTYNGQPRIEIFPGWMSYVKPVSGKLNSYRTHKLAKLHPYFVLRNYPENINNWVVDPCVHWETGRPEIRANYFHNKHIGTIFYTDQVRQNETLSDKEYKIMLQFVVHRFYMAEIVLPNNVENLFAAYNWLESRDNATDKNYTTLLNYRVLETGPSRKTLEETEALKTIFNELKEKKLNSIKGFHLEFPNSYSCPWELAPLTFDANSFFAEIQHRHFKFGFAMNYACCMEYIERLVMQNTSSPQILSFFKQIEYFICVEEHQISNLRNKNTMGQVLDSQLYVKKAFQEFSPKHELYFRITLTDLPNANSAFSDAYMKTVSHFMQSGAAYDISYIIIQAFDKETKKNGWWEIKNSTDLSDPYTFVEKESEYTNRQIWRPQPLSSEVTDSEVNSVIFIIISVVSGIILTLCLVISSYIYLRYRRLARFLSDDEVKEFLNGRSVDADDEMQIETKENAEYMKFKSEYEISLSELQIDTKTILGSGAFGTVYKGIAKETPAAIKQPNRDCSKTCFKSVLSEVKILCFIGDHPNIVGFLGAYTKEIYKGVLYIATEFCSNGALEQFLRRKKTIVASQQEHLSLSIPQRECTLFLEDLYRFCFEVASGMEHVEKKHIVHGDLAARNVLLDDNYTCRIGDFGLSRKMYDYQKYVKTSQEPLPWKWMAHESLTKMEFTSKSDVWSFGVTIWEIFSLGSIPYSTFNWSIEFPDELKTGLRLTKPEFASENIYLKMLDCWNLEPERRPSFTDLSDLFKEMHNGSYTVLHENQ